jgi:hypothetical protein
MKNEQGARVMEEKLEELRKDWLGDEREHVYRGTLRSVVSRAHAGEPS